jgi:hypothetical protein
MYIFTKQSSCPLGTGMIKGYYKLTPSALKIHQEIAPWVVDALSRFCDQPKIALLDIGCSDGGNFWPVMRAIFEKGSFSATPQSIAICGLSLEKPSQYVGPFVFLKEHLAKNVTEFNALSEADKQLVVKRLLVSDAEVRQKIKVDADILGEGSHEKINCSPTVLDACKQALLSLMGIHHLEFTYVSGSFGNADVWKQCEQKMGKTADVMTTFTATHWLHRPTEDCFDGMDLECAPFESHRQTWCANYHTWLELAKSNLSPNGVLIAGDLISVPEDNGMMFPAKLGYQLLQEVLKKKGINNVKYSVYFPTEETRVEVLKTQGFDIKQNQRFSINEISHEAKSNIPEFCMQVVKSWSKWQLPPHLSDSEVDEVYQALTVKFREHLKSPNCQKTPDGMPKGMAYTYLGFVAEKT